MQFLIFVLPDIAVLTAALVCWIRSRHPGFAWFMAALAIKLANSLLWMFPYSLGTSPQFSIGGVVLVYALTLAPCVLMIISLRRFYATLVPKEKAVDDKNVVPTDWATVKRRGVGVIGVGLILAGIATVIRGIRFMTQFNGEFADLGAGPGAVLVGILCVGLSIHPRSPFRSRMANDSAGQQQTPSL